MIEIGRTIAQYRITGKSAVRDIGDIFQAEDTRLQKTVALRIIPPQVIRDADTREHFLHIARAASALDHPNIPPLYDIQDSDAGLVLAMPWYDGESLRSRIARGPLRIEDTIGIARQLAEGLAHAHAAGLVHRCVYPEAIRLTGQGVVMIMDFGVAEFFGDSALRTHPAGPSYLAPEQLRAREADERTDVWAFGVVLFEMLTGRLPFTGDTPARVRHAVLKDPPFDPSLNRRDIPGSLLTLCRECLRKNPSERPQSMDMVLSLLGHWPFDLDASLPGPRVWAHRRRLALSIASLAALVCALALFFRSCPS